MASPTNVTIIRINTIAETTDKDIQYESIWLVPCFNNSPQEGVGAGREQQGQDADANDGKPRDAHGRGK